MLRVAVIGTGYFSQYHYRAWQRMSDVQIVALHAVDRKSGQTVADEFGVATVFTDINELIESTKPDLVDIVTPPQSHVDIVRQCIAHHTPCICQKPFCNNFTEASSLIKDIQAANATVVVHENFRFQPWYRKLQQLLSENRIGDIYEVRFNLRPGDGQGESAYLDRQPYFQQQSKFLIQETGVHFIDVFRYLFGDITGVFARLTTLNPVITGEDAGIVLMEFANGVRGVLNGNRLADHASDNQRRTMGEMYIEGSGGSLALDGYGTIRYRGHGEEQSHVCDYTFEDLEFGGDCVYLTNRHVVDHLVADASLENEASAYLINRKIEEAIYKSHETGSWIAI